MPGRPPIEVTATPCRHGPRLSRPIVGDVIGFLLAWDEQEHGALWISGDILYDGVRQVAERARVDVALLHMEGVRFPVSGPVRYTVGPAGAAQPYISDPGVVSSSPVSSQVFRPERIIGQPP